MKPKLCRVPDPFDKKMNTLYRLIHKTICDHPRQGQACKGKVTIDASGVILNCPLCGDVKKLWRQHE